MRRKLGKLALAVSVLAGGLVLGVSPRQASAAFPTCAPICCDTGCTLTRQCRWTISGCVCSPYCIGV